MPSMLSEALEWLDRAEQAREVAGQLTDPGARKAVLDLAKSSIASPEPPRRPRCSGEENWRRSTKKKLDDFSCPSRWIGGARLTGVSRPSSSVGTLNYFA